jgi:hypothetical protein
MTACRPLADSFADASLPFLGPRPHWLREADGPSVRLSFSLADVSSLSDFASNCFISANRSLCGCRQERRDLGARLLGLADHHQGLDDRQIGLVAEKAVGKSLAYFFQTTIAWRGWYMWSRSPCPAPDRRSRPPARRRWPPAADW